MMFLQFPGVPGNEPGLQRFRIWVPRLAGFAATLGVAVSLYLASRGYDEREHPEVKQLLLHYAAWCLAGAVAFLVAVSVRRSAFRAAYSGLKDATGLQRPLIAPVVNVLAVRAQGAGWVVWSVQAFGGLAVVHQQHIAAIQ